MTSWCLLLKIDATRGAKQAGGQSLGDDCRLTPDGSGHWRGVGRTEQVRCVLVTSHDYRVTCALIRMIDEMDEDMQRTETRLTSLTRRVNKAIRKSSG